MHTELVRNIIARDNSEDIGVVDRIILKWIFRKKAGNALTGLI
jgi:hypothetical protein